MKFKCFLGHFNIKQVIRTKSDQWEPQNELYYKFEVNYLQVKMEAEFVVMRSKRMNGVESGRSGADPLAIRVWHGESDGGSGNTAHALGAAELPIVELGLLRTGGRKHDGIPGGNPIGVSDRQPQTVPGFPEHRGKVSLPPIRPLFGRRESFV